MYTQSSVATPRSNRTYDRSAWRIYRS